MAMNPKLLEVLVCPACKGSLAPVRWQGDASGQTGQTAETGGAPALVGLDCRACRLRFPIVDEIPVMLVDQAQRITA